MEFGPGFNWFFNDQTVNIAPILVSIGSQNVTEAQTLDVAISASDTDGDNITMSASNLQSFMTFSDLGNGNASLDIAPFLGDAGSYDITISVTDDGLPALTTDEVITVTVDELDTDGDGLGDYVEINQTLTNPNLADTDLDFIDDGVEVSLGSDPLDGNDWPAIADGDLAPLGNPDGQINVADFLIAARISSGELIATSLELAHGDVYPAGSPDGVIDVSDLLLIRNLTLP